MHSCCEAALKCEMSRRAEPGFLKSKVFQRQSECMSERVNADAISAKSTLGQLQGGGSAFLLMDEGSILALALVFHGRSCLVTAGVADKMKV